MKLMTPFMKEKLRKKFVICDNADVLARLGGDPAKVPDFLGGSRELHLKHLLELFPELADVQLTAEAVPSAAASVTPGGGGAVQPNTIATK